MSKKVEITANGWSREKMIEQSTRYREATKALRARLPRRDIVCFEEEMNGFGPTMLQVVAESLVAVSSCGTDQLLEYLKGSLALHYLPTLLEDWLAKEHALKIALAALLDFDNIPASTQADYWSTFAGEDIPDLITLALGHKPMADDEDAPDLLRRVFLWGQDEDPDPETDDEGNPVEKEKPCKQTLPLIFEEVRDEHS